MKKVFAILVLASFLLSFCSITFAAPTLIDNLSLTITPSDRGAYAEYKITFVTHADLKQGYDNIYLQFPQESNIPCTSCAYAHCSDCFLINGTRVAGAGPVYELPKTVYFTVPSPGIKANEKVELVIKQTAAFQNPTMPGDYVLKVWTTQESEKAQVKFTITSTSVSNLTANTDPEYTKANIKLSLSFVTGTLGDLMNGKNIYIRFPDQFGLPKNPQASYVTVNGENPRNVALNGTTLALNLAYSIGANVKVNISFYPSFGLVSPQSQGNYSIEVYTDSEPTPVPVSISFKDKDFVRTLVETTPSEPNGKNGYFVSNVIVRLISETNTSESITTYYKLDESDYQTYTEPILLKDGIHTIKYYSKTSKLKEDEKTATFKVDTTPPDLTINAKEVNYTYDKSFTFRGTLTEDGMLFINGEQIKILSDLSFEKSFDLKEGENFFHFIIVDSAGNKSEKLVLVVLDTTTPVLTVDSPKTNFEKFIGFVPVKGNVYPANCIVTVNDNVVLVDDYGNFDYKVSSYLTNSLTPINIKAIYPLTGKTVEQKLVVVLEKDNTIKLQIGSKIISVYGETKSMDVEPFIDKVSGRTLVPIRFISEALGFNVSYESKTKTVILTKNALKIEFTVGSKVAFVNGVKKSLDVAPIIKDSRTFVPIRFVSETMGYKVEWDSSTKIITIIP